MSPDYLKECVTVACFPRSRGDEPAYDLFRQ